MLATENSSRHGRASQPHSSFKPKRSGYEPSDAESDWQDSPWHDLKSGNHQMTGAMVADLKIVGSDLVRNTSSLSRSQWYSSSLDHDRSSPVKSLKTDLVPRRNCKSAYKIRREEISIEKTCPISRRNSKSSFKTRTDETSIEGQDVTKMRSEMRTNTSSSAFSEQRRQISPYKTRSEEPDPGNFEIKASIRRNTSPCSNDGRNQRSPNKDLNSQENRADHELIAASRVSARSNVGSRSVSAKRASEKAAEWQKDQQISMGVAERRGAQSPMPIARSQSRNQRDNEFWVDSSSKFPSAVDINERIANANLAKGVSNALMSQSIESISPGDIFFSRECALPTAVTVKGRGFESSFAPKETAIPGRNTAAVQPRSRGVVTRTVSNTSSGSVFSRQSSKTSIESNKMSDVSGKTSGSSRKFAAGRHRSQLDTWFACVRKGTCRNSKTPESRPIDEASFIEKAFVMENLRQFWADKHQPVSLGGFICHKQQAQYLNQLISYNNFPHILFKGPSGSGKKALSMALLHEIYGGTARNVSHDIRYFSIQDTGSAQVVVPITSSLHHMELNLKPEPKNGRYVLMTLMKEIVGNSASTPEVSGASLRADYKVIVLYEVDKLAENIQHLIKWMMDCYTDACKIILCCEDDTDLESIKSRCRVITVDAPVTHEIIEVLIQIARKENFDLSVSFATKIATKSKQNLRKAIMALEACKAHNYPFLDEQPIPLGWEEVLIDLAEEILADPSPKRLFSIRGKLQKLLIDFVHPKLILQKLVELFLKGVHAGLKRELYYWHAYYDKRLPTGLSALLKLEEFVAKFMSICRRDFIGRRYA